MCVLYNSFFFKGDEIATEKENSPKNDNERDETANKTTKPEKENTVLKDSTESAGIILHIRFYDHCKIKFVLINVLYLGRKGLCSTPTSLYISPYNILKA